MSRVLTCNLITLKCGCNSNFLKSFSKGNHTLQENLIPLLFQITGFRSISASDDDDDFNMKKKRRKVILSDDEGEEVGVVTESIKDALSVVDATEQPSEKDVPCSEHGDNAENIELNKSYLSESFGDSDEEEEVWLNSLYLLLIK